MSISEAHVNFTERYPVRIYLDHNATTPLCDQARRAIIGALDVAGNPSSIHEEGREARDWVERARRSVANLLGAGPGDIVLTSGGTEADCLGILGLARLAAERDRPRHVLTAAIEHPAVLGACDSLRESGFSPGHVRVDANGRIDMNHFEELCKKGAAVAAISAANHELGTVQDIQEIAAIAETHGILVHCDGVQAAGKMSLAAPDLGVASLAISSHKIYGPKGVGALWVRPDLDPGPLVPAGHQERERRPGTENVLGIVGMGAAAEHAGGSVGDDMARVAGLAEALEAGLQAIPGVRIHGAGAPRVGNTINAGFEGALGEAIVAALDLAGIAASTGAACTSGSVEPSSVLLGIGLPRERAIEAVRFSLGRGNTPADIERLLEVLPGIIARAREFR